MDRKNFLPGHRRTMEGRALGGDTCIPTFKAPTMQPGSLHHENTMRDGYSPKMLYALDELFYIFDQVKWQWGMDEKIMVAYEILCLSALQCTERWHGVEKMGMPDALSLLNMHDARHLECLMWAVYDGALLVGVQPELPGSHPWCTVLASLYKHIYKGCEDVAHCPPHMLASWDCQERIEVLHKEGRLGSAQGGQRRASRPRRRSRSREIGMSTPMAHHLARHRDATVGQPYPSMPTPCPN